MAEATYFTAAVASAAGANKHHLTLHNASGSGKTIRLYRITASGAPTGAVTGLIIALIAVRFTGIAPATGTAGTILKRVLGDANPPAGVTSRLAPTAVVTEEAIPFGTGVVSGEETGQANESRLYDFSMEGLKAVEIPEGSGLTVKQGALPSAGAVNIVVTFSLVP